MVNITNLGHPDDIKKDSFGKWTYSGSHIVSFHASFFKDGYIDVEKCAPGASGSNVYYLRRLHSVHPSNSSCRRLIALITGIITILDYFIYRKSGNFCCKNIFVVNGGYEN